MSAFSYNMQLTLEEHFYNLGQKYHEVGELYSLWILVKKDLTEKLFSSKRVFPHYSKHDANHSKSIIKNIEMFLGEERINKLSATDTFMLLMCSYAHDYGMAYDLEQIYTILEDADGSFKKFLNKQMKNSDVTAENAKKLYEYYHRQKGDGDLKALYRCIIETLEEYIRPEHWKGVQNIENDFNVIFQGRLNKRFVKSIISMCQMHGRKTEDIMLLDKFSNGLFTDLFHPRFIASMIRLGDLLDLDNGRFSKEFVDSFMSEKNEIPEISKIHYLKHEAITHFYVGPKKIEVKGECFGVNAELVAQELSNWLDWIDEECDFLIKEWDQIAQWDFGNPPKLKVKDIFVNGHKFLHNIYSLKMEMQQDKIFELLVGSNVYKNKYVAFREVIQNAIDASLFQLWIDLKGGKYTHYLPKGICIDNIQPNDIPSSVWSNYPIHINVYEDIGSNSVWIDIIDKGIGISEDDLICMSKIGDGKTSNPALMKILNEMPNWLKPSGVFGIGLQSVFQLTSKVEFFTKKINKTPRRIVFHSYSENKGSIYISKCHNNEYYDCFSQLSEQGTLVRLCIDKSLFKKASDFYECDLDFDNMEINHAVYVEVVKNILKSEILNNRNYFNIYFSDSIIEDGNINKVFRKGKTDYNPVQHYLGQGEKYRKYIVDENQFVSYNKYCLMFWDGKKNIMYRFKLCLPKQDIKDSTVFFLKNEKRILDVTYKFLSFSNIDSMYKNSIDKWNTYEDSLDKPYINENSFVSAKVDILDYPADRYLNIDRTVLKEGSYSFSELLDAEATAFSYICKRFLEKSKNLSVSELVLFTILFYRFIDNDDFLKFYESNLHTLENCKISICGTKIPLNNLAETNVVLYQTLWGKVVKKNLDANDIKLEKFSETFPEHFLVPIKISYINTEKCGFKKYECKFRSKSQKYELQISKDAKTIDYVSIIKNKNGSYNIKQLMKSLFKPDKDYKELIIYTAPKTFHKGSNYFNSLEYSIPGMILSPFDERSCEMMEHYIKAKDVSANKIKDDIWTYLKHSKFFARCVNYILKNNSYEEEMIISSYKKFVHEVVECICNDCEENKSAN